MPIRRPAYPLPATANPGRRIAWRRRGAAMAALRTTTCEERERRADGMTSGLIFTTRRLHCADSIPVDKLSAYKLSVYKLSVFNVVGVPARCFQSSLHVCEDHLILLALFLTAR